MNKLMIFVAAATLSSFAFAEEAKKIDTDFQSLDNNGDGFISQEEADDNNVWDHFIVIDTDGDNRLSQEEFRTYLTQNPGAIEEGEELLEEAE